MSITGRSLIVALEESPSTWGTEVAPGINDEIKVESISPITAVHDVVPDPSAGYAWLEKVENCRENVGPDLKIPFRYDGRFWTLISQLWGVDNKTGSEDPYTHTIAVLEAIDGSDLFCTIAAELGDSLIFEWESVKPTGITLSGPDGNGYMSLDVRTIANHLNLGSDATTDGDDFDAVTHMSLDSVLPPIVPFGNLAFRLNADAGALDAADTIPIKNFNFVFNRNFDREWASQGAAASEWHTDEPIENDVSTDSILTVELGDIAALTHLERFQDEAGLVKADVTFTYDATHSINLNLPLLKYIVPDIGVSGSSRIPQTLNFQLLEAAANPTGMADTTPYWVVTTEFATAYE